jgi:molybdopterin-containing oxidoreductase family iron-sulfur binding subunit
MSSLKNTDQSEKQYWRSLSELAESEEFQKYLDKEFIDVQVGQEGSVSRRRFMQLMGASFTLAGTTGCWWEGNGFWKEEKILPHARRPQGWAPGTTREFSTSFPLNGIAQGLRVTSADGRPVKIEGNPEDSATRGNTTSYAQASVLGLYDPDRSKTPAKAAAGGMQSISLADVEKALAASTADLAGGLGLAILTENDSSPSVARLKQSLMAKYPQARWVSYSPLHRDNEVKGSVGAFGQAARAHYDLTKADVLVTLDSDLLTKHPNSLQYAADWASNRNPDSGKMSRTYAVESRFTATGSTADHRYAVRPSQVKAYLVKLEDEVRRELNEPRL